MAIYKGDKEIVGLYKWPTEIIKRYKGSNLIYNVFKWLPYSYEHIYNSLVPSVINNKNVKEKAKLTKISGNGVVENQLDEDGDFHSNDSSYYSVTEPDYMSMSIANNVLTCSVVRSISSGTTGNLKINTAYKGHKYLFSTLVKSTVGNNTVRIGFSINNGVEYGDFLVNQGETKLLSGIYETVTNVTTQTAIIRFQGGHSAGNTFESYYYEVIDLTLMFGTGNEPTTITDNRIQALLNQGYIEYNTGTLKSVNIGEISSEPYNLFDDEFVNKGIQGDGRPFDGGTNLSSKNPIEVHGGKSYTFEVNYENSNAVFTNTFSHSIKFYSGLPISSSTFMSNHPFSLDETTKGKAVKDVEAPSNAKYAMIHCYYLTNPTEVTGQKWCFHLAGTRTGYAPYQAPSKISLGGLLDLNGAINSHDTFEITNTDYVFTRNVWKITLTGNETIDNLTQYGTNFMGIGNLFSSNVVPKDSQLPMFNKRSFVKGSISNLPEGSCYTYSRNWYYNIGTNDQQANIDFITGLDIIYELATPQVITIQKKHLAVVDMGSMAWGKMSNGKFYTDSIAGVIKQNTNYNGYPNLICAKYSTDKPSTMASSSPTDKTISVGGNGVTVIVCDNDYADAAAFKQAMSGVYLFYETEDEVADIIFDINIEAGGSVTTNWFSWIENQLVSPFDNTGWTSNVGTYAMVDSRKATITLTTNTGSSYSTLLRVYINGSACTNIIPPNHKALVYFKLTSTKTSNGSNAVYIGNGDYRFNFTIANGINHICGIINYTGSDTSANSVISLDLTNTNYQVGDVITIEDYELIDLTLGFGAGKEPTSIDDPRIQYIIEQGYIPTNTTGTNKSVASEVLPNIDFKIKCK